MGDLRTYVERKGERFSPDNSELKRLASSLKVSSYTLYLVALGHKKLSLRKAIDLIELTEDAVTGASVCDDYPASISVRVLRKVG